MSTNEKVLKWAPRLEWITLMALFILPVGVAGGLLLSGSMTEAVASNAQAYVAPGSLTTAQVATSIGLSLITPLILMGILWNMRDLFQSYRRGEILTPGCADRIIRTGQGFLALALVPFVLQPVQTALLTLNNPQGERAISIGLNSDMLLFALSGAWIIVIGWAMREASDVAAENRAFV